MCGGAVSCVLEMALGGGARTPPPRGKQTIVNSCHTCGDAPPEAREIIAGMLSPESNLKYKNIYL